MQCRVSRASAMVLALLLVGSLSAAAGAAPPGQYPCEQDLIEVMFERDSEVRLREHGLVDRATDALAGINEALEPLAWHEWRRAIDVPESRLDELHEEGEANTRKWLYNMNNIYRLRIPPGEDVWQVSRELETLPGVHMAYPVPLPTPPPLPDDYEWQQGYLDPSSDVPSGVNAEYSWTLNGGDGTGVTVCDIEYDWNYDHGDLTKAVGSQIMSDTSDPFNDQEHGTAVIGVMVSDDNGWGTTGICKSAGLLTAGTYYGTPTPEWNVAGAIAAATDTLEAGDVIVLEQQWDYYGGGTYIPIEWWGATYPVSQGYSSVYIAIENAVAVGIHVVEAGGNGGVDTGALTWYGDSGAIIVGAGGASIGPNADLQRLSFSSYGGRFNLQGWGENVVTTGYNDLYDDEGENYYYTAIFSGTSSATPVVAGAVACCVGYWKGLGWDASLLTPSHLRSILTWTGTPQNWSVTGQIGPRPNVRAADSLLVQEEVEWADASAAPHSNEGGGSGGIAWGDYDGDGDQDIYVSSYWNPNKLYRNDGFGNFADVTASPLDDASGNTVSAWGDYDNDGDLDLYLGCDGYANKLLRNDGTGGFTDVTSGPLGDIQGASSLAWVDYDNDGNVDLYIGNYDSGNVLLKNNGDGTFSDATTGGLGDATGDGAVVWGDYDSDGDQDLYLANGWAANKLFRNDGAGSFTDVTTGPLGDTGYGIAAAWGDYDNDEDLDLFIVNNGENDVLLRNDGGTTFTDVTSGPLVGRGYEFGCTWGDYDNDGDLDLYISMGYCCNQLLRNDGGDTFVDRTTGPLGDWQEYSLGTGFADYDSDGDVDLYVGNQGTWDLSRLFRNEIGSSNNWIHVTLEGTESNRAAIGARVRVVTGRGSQIREVSGGSGFRSQDSMTAEFGLGSQTVVDSIIVNWPSGNTDVVTTLVANQFVILTETGTSVSGGEPLSFRLLPNTPNPFSESTLIRYDLPQSAEVTLAIYDLSGRRVRTLLSSAVRAPGGHEARWGGRDDTGSAVASGVYFVKLEAGADVERRRLVFLK